jgi:hypothetical protein
MADAFYGSLLRHTPMIATGAAEFFFVANDPIPELVAHLEMRGYPFIVKTHMRLDDETLFRLGYAKPEYMARVYAGYNAGIEHARGEYVCLVNSDNYFSPGWLENLTRYADPLRVVTSTLVERAHPVHDVFPGAVQGEFGGTVDDFDEPGFLAFAESIATAGLGKGVVYMPALVHRATAIDAGLYPCGNIAGASFGEVARYGDEAFFDRLKDRGVEHVTARDSIVYHLKEGEKDA